MDRGGREARRRLADASGGRSHRGPDGARRHPPRSLAERKEKRPPWALLNGDRCRDDQPPTPTVSMARKSCPTREREGGRGGISIHGPSGSNARRTSRFRATYGARGGV